MAHVQKQLLDHVKVCTQRGLTFISGGWTRLKVGGGGGDSTNNLWGLKGQKYYKGQRGKNIDSNRGVYKKYFDNPPICLSETHKNGHLGGGLRKLCINWEGSLKILHSRMGIYEDFQNFAQIRPGATSNYKCSLIKVPNRETCLLPGRHSFIVVIPEWISWESSYIHTYLIHSQKQSAHLAVN